MPVRETLFSLSQLSSHQALVYEQVGEVGLHLE